MIALLRRRDFGLLWAAGLISTAGDFMLIIALPLHVYARTGSALAGGGELAWPSAVVDVSRIRVGRPRKSPRVAS